MIDSNIGFAMYNACFHTHAHTYTRARAHISSRQCTYASRFGGLCGYCVLPAAGSEVPVLVASLCAVACGGAR